jgi:protein-export membrane protein SecD/preprotein translocase SecF subunit
MELAFLMKQQRWRMIFVAALSIWAVYLTAPSIFYFSTPKEVRNDDEKLRERIPSFLPIKHVKLGLDLQGGVQLVLGVNTDGAVDNKLSRIGTEVIRFAEEKKLGVEKAYVVSGQQKLRIEFAESQDVGEFKVLFNEEYSGLEQVDRDGSKVDFAYDDDQITRIKKSAIEQAERVIRNRVDKWGVAEPVINRRQADNSILVQLPGFSDTSKAKELLGRTAQLRFHIVDDEFTGFDTLAGKEPEGIVSANHGQPAWSTECGISDGCNDKLLEFLGQVKMPDDRRLYLQREVLAAGKKYKFTSYVVDAATGVGGDDIIDAFVSQDQSGLDNRPVVSMQFTGPGGKRFGDITGDNVGKRLGIVLDDEMVSAPNIDEKIPSGRAIIRLGSGNYNTAYEEAQDLALVLKSGALPATIQVLEERQVGASLGPELADQGVKGLLLGLGLVLIFMLFYYRRPGIIACTALIMNALFLLAIMAGFGFALTLPGLAGFILTLGMAVDANVLINERIRQEMREGKNARKAVESGFAKVFWTIIDANVTTLIAALVLLETNSSGPIRGFAVTLMIGLLVSMFTSLYCSKLLFNIALAGKATDAAVRKWLGGDSASEKKYFNVNFLKYGKPAAVIGIGLTVAVLAVGGIRGINWGVDFAGGTEIMLGFGEDTSGDQIRETGSKVGIKAMTLQALEGSQRKYLVRFGESGDGKSSAANEEALRVQDFKSQVEKDLASQKPEFLQIDFVGPQIGKELRNQGVMSVIYAIIGVLLYIGLRFDMRFGPGAVIKMVQDVFIMFGFYIFFWRSFDLTSVAAFMTVVGYSVNDTIVIYDRIRENLTLHAKRSMFDNINTSLNETLSRTINTSITTVVALVGILLFCSGQIWNFAMAMTIGVIAATLSSQFLASSFILWSERWKKARASKTGPGRPATAT